jgi:enoyl-CoA hydratase/carnithine racemase
MTGGSFEQILVRRHGRRATVALNRPAKLNALTDRMLGELRTALAELEADDGVRVVVLSGEGRAFCSGFDVTAHPGEWTPSEWRDHLHNAIETFASIWTLKQPVVAEVHGACLGGGFELVMACDLVVAAADAFFGLPEVRMGGVVMYPMLPWLVGLRAAKYITFTGERLSAAEAGAMHLVNKVVPAERLSAAVDALCETLGQIPAGALPLNKQVLNRVAELMGLAQAVGLGEDQSVLNFVIKSDEAKEFRRIVTRDGFKAAVAWMQDRYRSGECS